MRYAFVEQQGDSYPVQALCEALQVSDSGYAAWRCGAGPQEWPSDGALLKLIREIHQETKAAYGSPRPDPVARAPFSASHAVRSGIDVGAPGWTCRSSVKAMARALFTLELR